MLEIDQRGGVDGTQFTLLGKKGEPFQLLSQVDLVSYPAAISEAQQYLDTIAGDTVPMVKDGIDYDALGMQFKVLNVTIVKIKAIVTCVGGINPPSRAWLECVWELMAVEI